MPNKKCPHCNDEFARLDRHIPNCKENPNNTRKVSTPTPCRFCGEIHMSGKGLVLHENHCSKNPNKKIAAKSKKEQCPHCQGSFQRLKKHIKSCLKNLDKAPAKRTPQTKVPCPHCGEIFAEMHQKYCKKNPNKIKKVMSPTLSSRNCSYCGQKVKYQRDLIRHESSCPKNPNFKPLKLPEKTNSPCQYCGTHKYTLKHTLKSHEMYCSKNPNALDRKPLKKAESPCQYCGAEFPTLLGVKKHESTCKHNPNYIPKDSIHEVSPSASILELSIHAFLSREMNNEVPITSLKIGSKEFDIFIEAKKIAIEVNGTFYHSSYPEFGVPNKYHLEKTDLSESHGNKLFHIAEHDWKVKNDLWKSMLSVAVGGKSCQKVMARKLIFKEFCNYDARTFLEENHMQGFRRATTAYGLFDGDNLVSMMSFSFNTRYQCQELIRFASLKYTLVLGGANKLWKNIQKVSPMEVLSYARRDWSSTLNNVYQRLGFNQIGVTPPGYQYVHPSKLANTEDYLVLPVSRQTFQKHKLLKMIDEGTMAKPEGELTEISITSHNGWYKFYDSGNIIYKFTL